MGDFDQILYSWLGEFPNGHVPKDNDARLYAFKDLFERCKANKIQKEYISPRILGKIVTETINPNLPNKVKRRNWAELNNKLVKMAFHSIYTEAVTQEENPLDSSIPAEELEEVSIEKQVYEHNKTVKKSEPPMPKMEHYADTVEAMPPINSEFDPEMAEILGLKIK